jgi:hypothetical protein
MNTNPCRHDATITRAARIGEWTADLRRHLDDCGDCRQTVALVVQLAVLATAAPPPQSPHALWLRAHYTRRARARSRLARMQLATGIVTPLLAFIGFTLARGTEGWAHLGQLSAPVVLAAALGVAVTVWVMLEGRSLRRVEESGS